MWAVDFSTPPQPIDGAYPRIFSVRDLASGMQLAWLAVEGESADVAVAATESLLERHGGPLVIKSDNGSAFKGTAWKAMADHWSLTPLYSPPKTPRYNGSCESSNGVMKTRTVIQAMKLGDAASWTGEMMAAALKQANELSRSPTPTSATATEKWMTRIAIDEVDRMEFKKVLDAWRRKLHNQLGEAEEGVAITASQLARTERRAVTQALVELGYLSVTWRSKPLPINAKRAAKFS